MVSIRRLLSAAGPLLGLLIALAVSLGATAHAQDFGSLRGMVSDADFDVPLGGVRVLIAETGQQAETAEEGNYLIPEVAVGAYTLVFSREGFSRQVRSNVVVSPGQVTEVNTSLSGEFTEVDTYVVQELQFGGGTEVGLLNLRFDAAGLIDSVGADILSLAGASDAAAGLQLVAGATVQDGKYAVVRGLPDRFVNSQMNGVRLPTADEDKRAVQLDQFPAAIIESIQVSKTFTPDQQGDASGGAVNIVLKGIPDRNVLKFSSQVGMNTEVVTADQFLTYSDGGVNAFGIEERDPQPAGQHWDGAVGVSDGDMPIDHKWSLAGGGKHDFDGLLFGGFGSFFYERDSGVITDGIDDRYWVDKPGEPMTPRYGQGTPTQGQFVTSLFDVTRGTEQVQWGALGTTGVEIEDHSLNLVYLYTRATEDEAILAEDTRGKEYYYPGYDPNDPNDPGNQDFMAAPYLRTETLSYSERETQTLQLKGSHRFDAPTFELINILRTLEPEIDWGVSFSSASLYEPDKRQFGTQWWGRRPGNQAPVHRQFKPAANFTIGNLQRTWKEIEEESDQFFIDLKIPFEQWSENEGYFKFGIFRDEVTRLFEQESYSNFSENNASYQAPFEDLFSEVWPDEDHPITGGEVDVDYEGNQRISAWYHMVDLPLHDTFNVIAGARYETTELSIVNEPERDVRWIPPNSSSPVFLRPGDADVTFNQKDILPSVGFVYRPIEKVSFRGSYTETIARQTFKELSPIQQQEFLGGDVFVGNPDLGMASLKNYDLRLDFIPYEGGLVSFSAFHKDVKDPIEYVQRVVQFGFTTPVNYPEGELSGLELELRQSLGRFWEKLEGLNLGANATIINSEVVLPEREAAIFRSNRIQAPMDTRDMTNAPERLYNLYATWALDEMGLKGTELGLFYTVRGDTLVAGAGQSNGNLIPNVYETEYGTLNLSVKQQIGENWSVKFQGKNLTNPDIETVYRSRYIGEDVTRTSYQKGLEFSLSVSAEF